MAGSTTPAEAANSQGATTVDHTALAADADTSTNTTDTTDTTDPGSLAETTTSITTAPSLTSHTHKHAAPLGSDVDKPGAPSAPAAAPAATAATTTAMTAAATAGTSASFNAVEGQMAPYQHPALPAGGTADALIELVVQGAEAEAHLAPTAVPSQQSVLSLLPHVIAPGPDPAGHDADHVFGNVFDNVSVSDTPPADDIELSTYATVVETYGDDIHSALTNTYIGASVGRPNMFRGGRHAPVDKELLRKERIIAGGSQLVLPSNAIKVGNTLVPTLDNSSSTLPFRNDSVPAWQTLAGVEGWHANHVDDDTDSMIGCLDEVDVGND